jgi:hypothetical protein
MTLRMLCSGCGTITDFAALPAEAGFDPAERICLRCGEARWLPRETFAERTTRPTTAA